MVLTLRGSLYKLGEERDKQFSLIIEALSDENSMVRGRAASGLIQIGTTEAVKAVDELIEPLIKKLGDEAATRKSVHFP